MAKIAIASSGLGHIARGVESWASDTAHMLHRSGADVSLFQGGGTQAEPWQHVLPCWHRFEPRTVRLFAITKKLGGWRYGCGSQYDIEQTTFALSLWQSISRDYDILHVQDERVARILQGLNEWGWSRPRVILGNGTEGEDSTLVKCRYLQHLSPHYLKQWAPRKPSRQLAFAIPNPVDTKLFRPGDRRAARAGWKLPQDALIVLCVAALRKTHKRCDYVIREFDAFSRAAGAPVFLVMAGAWEKETAELIELGKSLLGDSLLVLQSVDRAKMPSLYQAADIFTIGSLHEMLGTGVLEALSTGLPITCNRTPIFDWVAGPAGALEDISQPGGLVRQWCALLEPGVRAERSAAAREHAEKTFSQDVVLSQMLEMYSAVLADPGRGSQNRS